MTMTNEAPQTPASAPTAARKKLVPLPAPVPAEHSDAPVGDEASLRAAVDAASGVLRDAQVACSRARQACASAEQTKVARSRDYHAAPGDAAWAAVQAAMTGCERSSADLAHAEAAEIAARRALTEADGALRTLQSGRLVETQRGRLALLREALTFGAAAKAAEAPSLRFARAYRELLTAAGELNVLSAQRAQNFAEAEVLAVALKQPAPVKVRAVLEGMLAGRVAWETMTQAERMTGVPRVIAPLVGSAWEEAETPTEAAAVAALVAKARV